jgi:hypothetical protein
MSDRFEDDLMEDLMAEPQASGHPADEFDEAEEAEAFDEADEFDEAEEFDEADEFEDAEGFEAAEAYDSGEEYDAADELEEAMTDALEAEDEDEFFGGFGKILRKVGKTVGSVARRVAPIAKFIPLPQAQLIGRAADLIGNVLADEGDEFDSLDALAELADEEDGFDALAPVVAGLAIRGALKHKAAHLPREHRRLLVKTVAAATKQIARKHGAAAAIAAPAIVRAARKIVLRKRLPVAQLPRIVKSVARVALRSPRTLRKLVRVAARLRAAPGGLRHRHRGHRRAYSGGYWRFGGAAPVGTGMSLTGAPSAKFGAPGKIRAGGGYRALGGGYRALGGGGYRVLGGGGAAGGCPTCQGRSFRFRGPVTVTIHSS